MNNKHKQSLLRMYMYQALYTITELIIPTIFPKAKCENARKELALPRASHSGEIALTGSRRMRSTLPAALILLVHAVVTVAKLGIIITLSYIGSGILKRETVPVPTVTSTQCESSDMKIETVGITKA